MTYVSWNNEKTLSFINAVRLHPELWDVEDVSYKDRCTKRESWNTVAGEFNITGEDAYRKFKSLRTYTKNEYRNVQKKGGRVVWFAYEAMQFILSRDLADFNVDSESTPNPPQPDQLELDAEDLPLQFVAAQQTARKPQEPLQNKDTSEVAFDFINSSSRKRRYPYSGFTEHIANKLSSYDQYTRTQVEFQISRILYEADMNMLRGGQQLFDTPKTYANVYPPTLIKENGLSPVFESTANSSKVHASTISSKTSQDTITTEIEEVIIKEESPLF